MTSATPELDVALKDGTTVHVRPVVAADEAQLSRLLGGEDGTTVDVRLDEDYKVVVIEGDSEDE